MAHRELAVPITNLINAAISNDCFSDVMKCAEVRPVYKNRIIYLRVQSTHEHVCAIFEKYLSSFRKDYSCHHYYYDL